MPMLRAQSPKVAFDKDDLRERLDPIEYHVTQEKGTERPYTNKYYRHYEKGMYTCVVCAEDLFDSTTKYDSGSGWPAFYDVITEDKLITRADSSGVGANLLRIVHNPHLIRTEVLCQNCGSHLGHVFKDGPPPTGKRYCINSSSLNFRASDEPDSSDTTDGTEKTILKHAATINGCGADGFCTLKARQAAAASVASAPAVTQRLEEAAAPTSSDAEHSVG